LAKSQSGDSETTQSSSFAEIFKVEEKKLQLEQESNALSIAAVLATIQAPVSLDAASVLDAEVGSEVGKLGAQSALQATLTTQPMPELLPNKTGDSQVKTAVEENMFKNQVSTSMPTVVRAEVAKAKTVEMPSSESVVSDTAMDLPTTVRAEVVSAKPVVIAKMVDVPYSVPVISDTAIDLPTAVRTEVASAKPVVEAKAVEIPSSAPVVSDIAIDLPTLVRAEAANAKPVVEAKAVEMPSSAPVVLDTAIDLPTAVRTEVANAKPVVEAKAVEMPSSAPVVLDTAPTVVRVETVSAKPVVEAKTVEMLSSAPVVLDTAPTVVRVETVSAKPVVEAKAVEMSSRVSIPIQVDDLLKAQLNQKDTRSASETPAPVFETKPVMTAPTVETVVVKEAATQGNAQINEVIQQIMSQMKVKIKSGATSMRLQLNPKELGAIEVQMIRNTEGVSVTFFAEQVSTGHLLETQMNQLRQSLKDAGVQLTGLNVSQHDQPKQEGGFFKQDPAFSQYFQRGAPQTETANKERERPERIGGSSTAIDYLI